MHHPGLLALDLRAQGHGSVRQQKLRDRCDGTTVRERLEEKSPEKLIKLDARPDPFTDPFSVLARVIRGSLMLDQHDQYSLKVNVIAAEILDAARRSAKEGKTVMLKDTDAR